MLLRHPVVPLAILKGSDDPFLVHGYIHDLKLGTQWQGAPQDMADGRHAPSLLRAEAFNEALVARQRHGGAAAGAASPPW